MTTIKNMMMAMTAVVAMMTASDNSAMAASKSRGNAEAPSIVSETIRVPEVKQYYFVNSKNESRRFEYTIDAQGRVTDRVMYGWNNNSQSWYPMTRVHAKYGEKTHKLTFATWNPEQESFSNHISSQTFNAADFSSIINLPVNANK